MTIKSSKKQVRKTPASPPTQSPDSSPAKTPPAKTPAAEIPPTKTAPACPKVWSSWLGGGSLGTCPQVMCVKESS